MKIEVIEGNVIFPLFTEELRNNLKSKLHTERVNSEIRMKEDGWGKTKFGDPNPEFYGNHSRWFWNHFHGILNENLELLPYVRENGKIFMRVSEIVNDKFKVLPFPNIMDERCFKYFKDFEFKVEGLGKDFLKMNIGGYKNA